MPILLTTASSAQAKLAEIESQNSKDQENPNFSAFDTFASLSNDPVFDPGRLGKRSDGTEITKPEVERVKNSLYGRCMQNQIDTVSTDY